MRCSCDKYTYISTTGWSSEKCDEHRRFASSIRKDPTSLPPTVLAKTTL
jgi:hypothetical protein